MSIQNAISKHWDREIIEGADVPSPRKNREKILKKKIVLTSSFGILFQPFLENAEPVRRGADGFIESVDNGIYSDRRGKKLDTRFFADRKATIGRRTYSCFFW